VGNVSDDEAEPAPLGVERAQRSAKKAETEGRAPLAAKAGRTAVGAGAEAKAIEEIDSEEWTTKRQASMPVKGGPQDRQGDVCDEDSATPASTPAGCWR
jgi:hypothetical protein